MNREFVPTGSSSWSRAVVVVVVVVSVLLRPQKSHGKPARIESSSSTGGTGTTNCAIIMALTSSVMSSCTVLYWT